MTKQVFCEDLPVLNLNNVSLKRDQVSLFEDLNAVVHTGQKVGIVGRNGIGKSSLFELILNRLQPDIGDVTRPRDWRIAYMAQEVAVTERPALEYVIDGHKALRRAQRKLKSAEQAGRDMEAAHLHSELDDLGAYQAAAQAGEILFGLGFAAEDEQLPFAEFSGGWRIRLNLAQALMAPTELLLLDEPTNHLDLEATLWLETWLQRFPGTLLVIAHDRDFLDNVTDHIIHLNSGQADTYRGNYSSFERQRSEALVLQQAAYTKQQREIRHIESFVTRFRAKASKARQAQSRLKALERMESVAPVHADSPYHIEFSNPKKMSHPLLSLDNLTIGYADTVVLQGVRQSILPGARIGVLGENGAGKSTLLKCLVGDLQPSAGELIRGQHASVGYFAQHQLETLRRDHSALEEVQNNHPEQREQWCRDYLAGWGFAKDKTQRPIATLSGGERARLVLALIAATQPAILVLDEPTNHLDLDMRDALAVALQSYTGALIVVAHDRSLLSRTVDEFWLVEAGRVNRLDSDLADYAAIHNRAGQTSNKAVMKQTANTHNGKQDSKQDGKKAVRRVAAEQRAGERPLRQKIKKLERRIEDLNERLADAEKRLADPAIYHDGPAEELDALLKDAASLRSKREAAEQAWLRSSEKLEQLQQS